MHQLAYIDSGSGSYIIQIIIALLLGVGYSLKLYWVKFKFLFKRNNKSTDKSE